MSQQNNDHHQAGPSKQAAPPGKAQPSLVQEVARNEANRADEQAPVQQVARPSFLDMTDQQFLEYKCKLTEADRAEIERFADIMSVDELFAEFDQTQWLEELREGFKYRPPKGKKGKGRKKYS